MLRGILRGGAVVPAAEPGDAVEIVLDRTPFYAEGGGQLADGGTVRLANGAVIEVDDVQQPVEGLIVHRGRVVAGSAETGLAVVGSVDTERRQAISRAHTATHMVHKAMRELVGDTATQAGSENAPGRFRFDFPNAGAVPASVLADVEQKVNEVLIDDLTVTAELMPIDEARSSGAMALFGEKYGDTVRVVSVGDWARELCGGTHAHRTGQLGVVKLLGESSIGAGVRRIEALVGLDAYRFLAREHTLVSLLTEQLKVPADELPERVSGIVQRLREAEKEIAAARRAQLAADLADVTAAAERVGDVDLYAFRAPDGLDGGALRDLALATRGRAGQDRAAVVLATVGDRRQGRSGRSRQRHRSERRPGRQGRAGCGAARDRGTRWRQGGRGAGRGKSGRRHRRGVGRRPGVARRELSPWPSMWLRRAPVVTAGRVSGSPSTPARSDRGRGQRQWPGAGLTGHDADPGGRRRRGGSGRGRAWCRRGHRGPSALPVRR